MTDVPSEQGDATRGFEGPMERSDSDPSSTGEVPTSDTDGLVDGDGRDPFVPDGEQATVISARKPSSLPIERITSREIGAALVGTQLHNYRLDEFVGGGGMGAVFRATDTVLGRTVAVKIMARIRPTEDLTKRFINEAQSAAQLDHQNIARVHNAGHADGLNYIVFEFVQGENLREKIARDGPLTYEEAVLHTLKISEALAHASERNVIHRDIKPSNVIIDSEGKLKLVDMGLARMNRVDADDAELTASGMTLGTFDYLSPEQASDPRQADVRSDLYSLGCTLYFMVTGEPPFPDFTPVQKLIQHREGKRPDPRNLRPDIPIELVQIIRKLTAPKPAHRIQSPHELIASLTLFGRQRGMTLSSPVSDQALAEYLHRRGWVQLTLPVAIPALLLALVLVSVELVRGNAGASADLVTPSYLTELSADDRVDSNQSTDAAGQGTRQSDDDINDDQRSLNGDEVDEQSDGDEPDGSNSDTASDSDQQSANSRIPFLSNDGGTIDRDPIAGGGDETSGMGTSGDSETSDQQTPDPGPAPPVVLADITRLVVGELNELDGPESNEVANLRMALLQRGMYPNLEFIEIRDNGPFTVDPFEFVGDSLIVQAAAGYRPLILVEMTVDDSRPLIGLTGKLLMFEGLDWVWTVPSASSVPRWSLFRVKQERLIEGSEQALAFRDCTFTVHVDSSPSAYAESQASLVRIDRPDVQEFDTDDARVFAEPPSIQLDNCAIRGDVLLASAREATPFVIDWNEGLFVSNQSLIACDGSIMPRSGFNNYSLFLSDVTMVAHKGLARLHATEIYPEQLKLIVDAERCIFDVPNDVALVEQVGPEPIEPQRAMSWTGEFGFVSITTPLWSFRLMDATEYNESIDATEADQRGLWNAADAFNPLTQALWETLPQDRPLDLEAARVIHFRLSEDQANPAHRFEAGFDTQRLPRFPDLGDMGQGSVSDDTSAADEISMPNEFDMDSD